MVTFGLITEGITDQIIIENILTGFFNKELEFNQLQPLRDETDQYRATNYGGWCKVVEYCANDEFKQAFQFCNYINKKKSKLTNCVGTLNQALQKKETFTIDAKNPEYYEDVSKKYLKNRVLMKHYKDNPSLKIFIEEVDKKNIIIDDEDDF
jgi:hypothetical protein